MNHRLFKANSILGVPKRQDYPLKEELYKLRRTEPSSPSYFRKQSSSPGPDEAEPRFKRASSLRKSSLSTTEIFNRRLSLKEFICLRRFSKIDPAPETDERQGKASNILDLLLSKAKPKPGILRRSLSKADKTGVVQIIDPPANLSQRLPLNISPKVPDVPRLTSELHFTANFKSFSNGLNPTKLIRKVVGLPKMPFGKHSAYPSEEPFRAKHVVEKESAKWLTVHSSKRISPERKRKASKPK